MWFILALASSIFAALTTILAKIGIAGVNSTLATALRTGVVLVMSWGMVFLTDAQHGLGGQGMNDFFPVFPGNDRGGIRLFVITAELCKYLVEGYSHGYGKSRFFLHCLFDAFCNLHSASE